MERAGTDLATRVERIRRLVMTCVALVLMTGNMYVAAQPAPIRRAAWNPLPRIPVLWDMFLLPGMFSSYSRMNQQPFIGGQRTTTGRATDRGQWVRLEVEEHLPHRRGVNYTRIHSVRHRDVLGKRGQQRAWRFLAARIREHHNRLHPDWPVARIRIGVLEWPKSPGGFEARRTARELRVQTFLVEDGSP